MITLKRIPIVHCTAGVYLRWWFNGWHYFNFQNGYEITMQTESMDTQVTRFFSIISKIERPTKLKAKYSYQITLEGITDLNIKGFTGLLLAEKVEQYEGTTWYEVEITRGDHLIKDENSPGYILNFEITRKELANTPAVYQKSQSLYLDDVLCDIDDSEVIPVNKQTNDIAEMQDRQSDFTASFKIRKTRAMKALFELSGEVGANTTFPYTKQICKLIQDNIEMITGGTLILDGGDDQYYIVSILSGNRSFFKEIDGKKITDLTLAGANHTWNAVTQAASNAGDLDYVYPLCEPSDDGGVSPLTDTGSRVNIDGKLIWPFVKLKTIWDEIFSNAGFTCEGNILTDDRFLNMFMPITNLQITKAKIDQALYSLWWGGSKVFGTMGGPDVILPGGTLINGDALFATGHYTVPYSGTYKIQVFVMAMSGHPALKLYKNGAYNSDFALTITGIFGITGQYDIEYSATAGEDLTIYTNPYYILYYSIAITEIKDPQIGYGSTLVLRNHLTDMSQTEFIKMICNLFGLIPSVTARDKKIKFWNYSVLYSNINIARNWSAYLSERDDSVGFKFGDYAQSNYLKYKDSKDVIPDNGKGTMLVADETLPAEKDVVSIPVSTCDEVEILGTIPVSRIAFNKYDSKTLTYIKNTSIESRIVYVKQIDNTKTFGILDNASPQGSHDIIGPRIACSLEVSFSTLVVNYASLSRMLTKTNLRKAKFNLPVYEVAGFRHDIPIYLSQYKAYFYVNKINNYIPGKLCTIDLIKL